MAVITLVNTGNKSLNRLLNALGSDRARKANQAAMRDAMKTVVLPACEREIPVSGDETPGTLRKSLSVRVRKWKRNRIGVMVTQNPGKFRGEAYYGANVELGHRVRGKSRAKLDMSNLVAFAQQVNAAPTREAKKVKGKWYMRNASIASEQDAIGAYYDGLEKLIEREERRCGYD